MSRAVGTAGDISALVDDLVVSTATGAVFGELDVADTTGCGDAFRAGFLTAVLHGRTPRGAAVTGDATAAQVVQGLGADHGTSDLAPVEAFASSTPARG